MNESKNWITHVEFVVLLTTLLGSFYLLDGKIERQSNRTDHLYEMFLEVQKEIKDLYVRTAIIEKEIEKNDR
jgi:hypothetical protein